MLSEMVYSPMCCCSVATCKQSSLSLSPWEVLMEIVMVKLSGDDGMMQVLMIASTVSLGISLERV